MFYYFYFDFGIIGIIIESMAYGLICHILYHDSIIMNDRSKLLLYLLAMQTIMFSFVRWQFGTAGFIVEIFFALLILSKRRNINKTGTPECQKIK